MNRGDSGIEGITYASYLSLNSFVAAKTAGRRQGWLKYWPCGELGLAPHLLHLQSYGDGVVCPRRRMKLFWSRCLDVSSSFDRYEASPRTFGNSRLTLDPSPVLAHYHIQLFLGDCFSDGGMGGCHTNMHSLLRVADPFPPCSRYVSVPLAAA